MLKQQNKQNRNTIVPVSQSSPQEANVTKGAYFLFSGTKHYPGGGWNDFKGKFSTIDDAVRFLNREIDIYDREWFQVVSTDTLEKVLYFES